MIGTAPQYINWNYTYVCNLKCTHCYSRSPRYPKDLPNAQYVDIARQIVENNVFAVGFGGGEPTLRKDFLEILGILSSGGVDTHLTTNGTVLDKKYIQFLREAELGTLLVSVDSHDRRLNDQIRNKEGAFDLSCEVIRKSVASGIRTLIACVVNAKNFDEIKRMAELAINLGANGINLKLFRASGGAVQSKHLYELNDEQKQQLPNIISEIRASTSLDVETYQDTNNDSCSCGVTQLTVRPNGDVSLCPYSSHVIGNLTSTSLKDLWKHSVELQNRRNSEAPCLSAVSRTYPYNPAIPITELRKC